MSYKYFIIILLPFLFAACKNKSSDEKAPVYRWYKRYTGTIAGMQVVANLFFDGDKAAADGVLSVSGNYYYCRKSDQLDLVSGEIKNNVIELKEYSAQDSDDQNAKHPRWLIKISDTGLSGTWMNADGNKTYPIHLKENYGPGSYAFDVITVQDSTTFKGPKEEYQMSSDYTLLTPADKTSPEGQFIIHSLLHALGGDSLKAKDLNDFIKISNKRDFAEYTSTLTDMFKDTAIDEGESNNWDEGLNGTLEYNDRGLVVFGFLAEGYTGGAHPNHNSSYLTLDVTGRKTIHLGDILNVDTLKLRSMLETLVRKKFDMKPEDSLSSRLLVDTIPFTENFIISETGITFFYNAYEIASYADGDSDYYLSYSKLGDMLKPEFRARMNK